MLKWLALAVAFAILLLVGMATAVPYLVDTFRVRSLVSQAATQVLGRPVRFSALTVSLLPMPALRLEDLRIEEDPRFGTTPFLTMGAGSFRLRLPSLLLGRLEFSELVLERPQLTLIRDAAGRMNVASIGAGPASSKSARSAPAAPGPSVPIVPVVSRVRVVNGTVTYASSTSRGQTASYRVHRLNLALAGIGLSSPIQFSGEGILDPGAVAIKIQDGIVAILGARTLWEGPLKARVLLEGRDVRSLASALIGASPALTGPGKGTLMLGGTVGSPLVSGALELPRLTVSEDRARCGSPRQRALTLREVTVPISWEADRLLILPLTAKLDRGTVSTNLTARMANPVGVQARDVAVRHLPLAPVLVDYLCQPYAVTGHLDLSGEFSARPPDVLGTLEGSGRFTIGPGNVVGGQAVKLLDRMLRIGGAVASVLAAEGPGALESAPLAFETISASYTIRRGVARTPDLRYRSRAFTLNAAGRYSLTDGAINLDVLMKAGRGEVSARVTGTAEAPTIRIDPASLVVYRRGFGRSPREVEQGVRELLRRLQ